VRFVRSVYVASGTRACEACGKPQEGPCEMYEYVDTHGAKMLVDFECRMFCTLDRTVKSFAERPH
jgi:hypothetical protein